MKEDIASVRAGFVDRFGEDQAAAIERAAEDHSGGEVRRGSDPFKWALLIAIGYQCMEKPSFRDHHGITAPWADLKAWIIKHGRLAEHDGDCDYLCAFVGGYNEFVGLPPEGETVQ